MNEIKTLWRASKTYRTWLVIAGIYFLLRLAAQVYFMMPSQATEGSVGEQLGADMQLSYVRASESFQAREDMYLKGSLEHVEEHYLYSPAFAFFFGPVFLLRADILTGLMIALHLLAYAVMYVGWLRIFRQNKLEKMSALWVKFLPLYLVFSPFWDDLAYMNTYIFMALFATLLIEATMKEQTGWASFWLGAVILPIKPQWAFAFLIPLLLGRYRFFSRLVFGTAAAYALVTAATLAGGGFEYVLSQYRDYVQFLGRLVRDYPWWGPDKPFLGYNHSVMQVILYFFGITPATFNLATGLKLLLLFPLGILGLRALQKPRQKAGHEAPEFALGLALALYLAAFIWLDMLWELSMAMTVFVYLWAVVLERWKKILIGALFFPYALIDVWRLLSYLIGGDSVIHNAGYVLTDPLIYIPVILLVLLVFYFLLLERLWILQKRPEGSRA